MIKCDNNLFCQTKQTVFVQSTKNPALLTAVRNKFFYKALYNLKEPDEELIKKAFKEFQGTLKFFDKTFMKGGPFFGGSSAINVGDLLAANTLEQVSVPCTNEDYQWSIGSKKTITLINWLFKANFIHSNFRQNL